MSTTTLDEYVRQLTDIEKKVYHIAKEHLETSFSLENSIGFKKWIKAQQVLAQQVLAQQVLAPQTHLQKQP